MSTSEGEYVNFGEISRSKLGRQAQYGSRFVNGSNGCPDLGEGLRFRGEVWNYHSLEIHKDDIETFVDRYHQYIDQKEASERSFEY